MWSDALRRIVRSAKRHSAYRVLALPRRAVIGGRFALATTPQYLKWLAQSKEETNFTYSLSEMNLQYLAHTLAVVARTTPELVRLYIDELLDDRELADFIISKTRESAYRNVSDARAGYAKRLGWYALVRLLKPRVVVETGVDKGLGSITLCRGLMRNATEGHPGRYIGTDINPEAGWLLQGAYAAFGEVRVGDSIATLEAMTETVDLFINDSDHSEDYEAREYEVISPRLSPEGIILGDNAHVTSKLAEFSTRQERSFLFFKEEPLDHWYPGAGIGFSFPRQY